MTKLSHGSKQDSTVGEMVNLMADDAMKLTRALFELHFLWIGPLQACVALYFLYQELKMAALVGFSLLLIFIPMNVFIAKKHHKINVSCCRYIFESLIQNLIHRITTSFINLIIIITERGKRY
jgi:hypothetical protein